MKEIVKIVLIIVFLSVSLFAQVLDVPFKQATSVKYIIPDEWKGTELKKVVVDYNDIVYVLTDKGLFRDYYENQLSKDLFYRLLSDKNPVDITVQESTGYLYYLYANEFLTNAHAGTIYAYFPEGEYNRILVNEDDQILLIGESSAVLYQRKDKISENKLPAGEFVNAYVNNKKFYYLTSAAIYRLDKENWTEVHR
ncbi:hypothetical protein MNBD_IGNAVI01-1879, partial [hydrothermal vent metagenome]